MLNTEKLYKALANNEKLKEIPVLEVVTVVIAVLEAINSGDCLEGEDWILQNQDK